MLRYLGFGYVSTDMLIGVIGLVFIFSIASGWLCDAVMKQSGFGIAGNGALVCLGSVATLVAWQRFGSGMGTADLARVAVVCILASYAFLFVMAVGKRLAR
jgi:hypothetical protein